MRFLAKRAQRAPRIWVDPKKAREHRDRKAYRLNVIQFPILRLVGFVLLLAAVVLHDRFIGGSTEAGVLWMAGALFLLYCAASWLLLFFFYERLRRFDLGLLFLALDLPLWTVAIYLSGAETSWLFFILSLRVADQTHTTMRRALVFGHIGTLCYLGMLAWVFHFEQRPLSWAEGLTKAFLIYSASFYIALAAQTAEGLRRRMVEAIRMARDSIAKLRRQSAQLEDARREAEQASQAKSAFLAMISHELRTPIAGVIGTADLLLHSAPSDEQRRYLETIRSSSEALLSIIDEILDFTRIETGELETQSRSFRLRGLLREVADLLTPVASTKGIRIDQEVDDELPDLLEGDSGRLRQVLINLLGNAVKYSERGPVTLRAASAGREEAEKGLRLKIEIEDHGIGISPEDGDRIFEPFYQADRSMARRHGGTGLGLAIARRLVEAMRGTLGYHSTPGEGSVFWFVLPMETPADADAQGKKLGGGFASRRLSRLLGGEGEDPELIDRWVELFLEDGHRHLAGLRRARGENDLESIARLARELRDESSGLGAEHLSKAYGELVAAAESGDPSRVDPALGRVERSLRSIQPDAVRPH